MKKAVNNAWELGEPVHSRAQQKAGNKSLLRVLPDYTSYRNYRFVPPLITRPVRTLARPEIPVSEKIVSQDLGKRCMQPRGVKAVICWWISMPRQER